MGLNFGDEAVGYSVEDLVGLFNAKKNGRGWVALCPAHDDRNPSLSINQGDNGEPVLHCFAGCKTEDVLSSVGLRFAGKLIVDGKNDVNRDESSFKHVAEYVYTATNGNPVYKKIRYEDGMGNKRFSLSHPTNNGWTRGRGNADWTLYNIQEVQAAARVVLVEGEKDVETLRNLGIVATCTPTGANGDWLKQYTDALKGKKVVVIPDNDKPGLDHARKAVKALLPHCEVVVLELGGPKGNDVTRWLANKTKNDLIDAMRSQAKPGKSWLNPWQWFTLADAYAPRPAREWVVDDLLPASSLSVIYGQPGGFKSLLALDLAMAVATGKPWLPATHGGGKSFKVGRPRPVLWVDVDNGAYTSLDRMEAVGRGHGANENTPFALVSFPNPPFMAGDPDSIDRLTDQITATNAGLVVIDNLGTVSMGIDENTTEIAEIMANLRDIAENTGAAVLVIHHRNKSVSAQGGNTLRGSSAILAALDLAIEVEREPDSDIATMKVTKSRHAPIPTFAALFTYERDKQAEKMKAARFLAAEVETEKLSKLQQAILCIQHDMTGEMTQSEIVKLVKTNAGVGRNTTMTAIQKMVRSGKLVELYRGARNSRIYKKMQVSVV